MNLKKHKRNRFFLLCLTAIFMINVMFPVSVMAYTVPDGSRKISSAKELPDKIEPGESYILANDITLEDGQQIESIGGILDGNGYTLTLSGKPLADSVSGIIQNLGVKSDKAINLNSSFGSMAVTLSGTIQNCYSVAPINTSGWEDIGGLVGILQGGTIKNSYYGGKSSAMFADGIAAEGRGGIIKNCLSTIGFSAVGINNPIPEIINYEKKSESSLKADDALALLNEGIEDTGYIWALPSDGSNNGMPILKKNESSLGDNKPHIDKSGLEKSIQDAEKAEQDLYTDESWDEVKKALIKAKDIYNKEDASQDEIDGASKSLNDALKALEKKMIKEPVSLPQDEGRIIHISSQDDLNLIDSGDENAYYVLDNDITLDKNYWMFDDLMGVFDGQGHAVIFDNPGTPLFANIGKSGVVQNTYFTGTIGSYGSKGPVGNSLKGTVINCYSDIKGDSVLGFAKTLDGGQVINSYSVSTGKKGVLFEKYISGKLINTYWLKGTSNPIMDNLVGASSVNSYEMTEEDMKTREFIELLNSNRSANGTQWGQNSDGYPYFGEDKEYSKPEDSDAAENKYILEFKPHDSENIEEIKSQLMSVSQDDAGKFGLYGTFSLKDVPEGSRIVWSCEDVLPEKCVMIGEDSGEFYVTGEGAGKVTATEIKSDGTVERVAELSIKSTAKSVRDIKIYIDGKEAAEGKYTVQGSEWKDIEVYALYEGEDKYVPALSSRFTYEVSDDSYIYNIEGYNSFYFKKPGTASIKAVSKKNPDVSAAVEITSEYVPVESVVPGISGDIILHGRNANSEKSEKFNPAIGTVIVTPDNASSRENYTVTSSSPSIGNFVKDFVYGYVPSKAGTTTYTASIEDTDPFGNTRVVSGSSTVTYRYKNPVTAIKVNKSDIELANNSSEVLDISFDGALSSDGYSITEPKLIWTYDKEGIVKIEQSSGGWKRDEFAPDNNCYLPGTEYKVYGLSEGTVVATGTPVDDTNGLEPVKVKITVSKGNAEAADIDGIIKRGMEGGIKYINSKDDGSYVYNEEWTIYTLLRCGYGISSEKLDGYYKSVCEKVKTWKADTKPTDIERVALTLSIMGKDIRDVDGINLAEMIYNHPDLDEGSNELIYALLSLDAKEIDIPEDAKWSRDEIIKSLISSFQCPDGGFGLFNNVNASVDITGMALQALAKYMDGNNGRIRQQTQMAVEKSINEALNYLKRNINASYGFGNDSESASQVLIGLCALLKDTANAADGFGTAYANIITFLDGFYCEDSGGFQHDMGGGMSLMATLQVMQGYTAYSLYKAGQGSYWNLMDYVMPEGGFNGEINDGNSSISSDKNEAQSGETDADSDNDGIVISENNLGFVSAHGQSMDIVPLHEDDYRESQASSQPENDEERPEENDGWKFTGGEYDAEKKNKSSESELLGSDRDSYFNKISITLGVIILIIGMAALLRSRKRERQ